MIVTDKDLNYFAADAMKEHRRGIAEERARIRRELLEWFFQMRSEPERADHFLTALDRICQKED